MKRLTGLYEKITDFLGKNKKIVIPVTYLLLASVPFLGVSQYFIRVLCLIGVYSILTLSLNLIAGYMGQTSMGHAALYCLADIFPHCWDRSWDGPSGSQFSSVCWEARWAD